MVPYCALLLHHQVAQGAASGAKPVVMICATTTLLGVWGGAERRKGRFIRWRIKRRKPSLIGGHPDEFLLLTGIGVGSLDNHKTVGLDPDIDESPDLRLVSFDTQV